MTALEAVRIVLTRVDERTKNTNKALADLESDVKGLRDDIQKNYVTRSEWTNLVDKVNLHQKVIFGVAASICLAVLSALLALVVQNGGAGAGP